MKALNAIAERVFQGCVVAGVVLGGIFIGIIGGQALLLLLRHAGLVETP